MVAFAAESRIQGPVAELVLSALEHFEEFPEQWAAADRNIEAAHVALAVAHRCLSSAIDDLFATNEGMSDGMQVNGLAAAALDSYAEQA